MKKISRMIPQLAALSMAVSCFAPIAIAQVGLPGSSILEGLTAQASPGVTGKTTVVSLPHYGEKEKFIIVTELQLPPHWHAYWTNPGTVGIPMEASMPAVKGVSISGPYWMAPTRGESELGVFYGYERPKVAFIATPEDPSKTYSLTTNVSWQMCRDGECLPPEDKSFTASIGGDEPTEDIFLASNMLKDIVGITIPSWFHGLKPSATQEGNTITLKLEFSPEAAKTLNSPSFYFFSQDGEIMPTAPQKVEKIGDTTYLIKLQRNLNEDSLYPNRQAEEDKPLPPMTKLEGVLTLNGQGISLHLDMTSPQGNVQSGAISASSEKAEIPVHMGDLLSIVIGLFLGGIILNLMPCVFPVIGLKILSFVKLGGGERKKVFSHSLAFVIGVIISFWVLTLILLLVKAGLAEEGQKITWAFWMEKPHVIFALILIMLIMSLSMYGVFEIGVTATSAGSGLQNKEGYAGSFWSGVLATVVATPCTAPFLSGAMAPALALPSWGMFIAFTGMGLGMSFPYIILGAFPNLVKYLPKPGAWMESFKQGISFILLGAVGWLFWVYMVNFEDPMDLFNAILGLVAISAACWVYGRWCPIYRNKRTRLIGAIIALVLFAGGAWYASPPSLDSNKNVQTQSESHQSAWDAWSPETVEKALASGRPVYVDFTARWCATCQTNKKLAYTPAVMELFKKYNVLLLKADKTRPNPQIDEAMTKLGRAAVPLNVLYIPDEKPLITREILTADYMEDFLNQAFETK